MLHIAFHMFSFHLNLFTEGQWLAQAACRACGAAQLCKRHGLVFSVNPLRPASLLVLYSSNYRIFRRIRNVSERSRVDRASTKIRIRKMLVSKHVSRNVSIRLSWPIFCKLRAISKRCLHAESRLWFSRVRFTFSSFSILFKRFHFSISSSQQYELVSLFSVLNRVITTYLNMWMPYFNVFDVSQG